jgi:hypothetical protein
LAIDPNNTLILQDKGNLLYYLGKYEEALALLTGLFDNALAMDTHNSLVLDNKGIPIDSLGKYEHEHIPNS